MNGRTDTSFQVSSLHFGRCDPALCQKISPLSQPVFRDIRSTIQGEAVVAANYRSLTLRARQEWEVASYKVPPCCSVPRTQFSWTASCSSAVSYEKSGPKVRLVRAVSFGAFLIRNWGNQDVTSHTSQPSQAPRTIDKIAKY